MPLRMMQRSPDRVEEGEVGSCDRNDTRIEITASRVQVLTVNDQVHHRVLQPFKIGTYISYTILVLSIVEYYLTIWHTLNGLKSIDKLMVEYYPDYQLDWEFLVTFAWFTVLSEVVVVGLLLWIVCDRCRGGRGGQVQEVEPEKALILDSGLVIAFGLVCLFFCLISTFYYYLILAKSLQCTYPEVRQSLINNTYLPEFMLRYPLCTALM